MSTGLLNLALVAGPPSPEKPAVLFPAKLVKAAGATNFATRWLPESAIYSAPLASNHIPLGAFNLPLVPLVPPVPPT